MSIRTIHTQQETRVAAWVDSPTGSYDILATYGGGPYVNLSWGAGPAFEVINVWDRQAAAATPEGLAEILTTWLVGIEEGDNPDDHAELANYYRHTA